MSDIETNVSKATPKPARRKVQATAIATRSISETGISSLQPIASSSRVEGLPSTPIDRTVGLMAGRTCQVFVEDLRPFERALNSEERTPVSLEQSLGALRGTRSRHHMELEIAQQLVTSHDQTIASLERRFESALRSFRREMSHSDREEDSDHEVRSAVEGIARSTLVDRKGQDDQDDEE